MSERVTFAAARLRETALRLDPASGRGWFDGEPLSIRGAAYVSEGASLAEAARALEDAFECRGRFALVVAAVTYEGVATVAGFHRDGESACCDSSAAPCVSSRPPSRGGQLIADARFSVDARAYRANVTAVRAAIKAGDVYVLNLTTRLAGSPILGSEEMYAELRARAPADMAAYLALPGLEIASISPERFVRVRAIGGTRVVEVWPIKGTRPRGSDAGSDERAARDLLRSPKERAEHVMVVDLERNDLGRVCVPGSVSASPLMETVETAYCHQLYSRVYGLLRPDVTFCELFEATFPCGSVTGAPKRAAMRIAAQLEGSPRGHYTGALFVARAGELDSSVLIRSAIHAGGSVAWGTGGGVTIDSDPAEEYLEVLLKSSPVTGDASPHRALRETCRVVDGTVPLLAYHLARLAAGGCGPSVLAHVRALVEERCHELSNGAPHTSSGVRSRLGITVLADGRVEAELDDRPSLIDVPDGLRLVPVRVDSVPELPRGAAKPAARTEWDAAQAPVGPGGHAVLVGPDGRLIDGASATVWLVSESRLVTPPAPPAVAGVAREVVFDIAPRIGLRAVVNDLTCDDLDRADELFLTNAYGGIGRVRGRSGAVTNAVAAAFERFVQARSGLT